MECNTLENVYENMLTHVHKVIHLVVGTFEQGLETSPAPCTEKIGFHSVDRTLASTGSARPVSRNSEDAGVGLRPDAGSLRYRTLARCIQSR